MRTDYFDDLLPDGVTHVTQPKTERVTSVQDNGTRDLLVLDGGRQLSAGGEAIPTDSDESNNIRHKEFRPWMVTIATT